MYLISTWNIRSESSGYIGENSIFLVFLDGVGYQGPSVGVYMRWLILVLSLLMMPAVSSARPGVDERLNQGAIIRDITIPDGQEWAFVRVRAVIDAPPRAVWETLSDIEHWPSWLPMNRKALFLAADADGLMTREIAHDRAQTMALFLAHPNRAGAQHAASRWDRLAYEEYDLPWPLKNEWVVRRYTFDEQAEQNRASWKKVDSSDDLEDGHWEVSPWKDGGKAHLRYYYRVKAKEGVPHPVFTTAVAFTVNSMIKALRHEVAKRLKAKGSPS